MFKSMTFSLGLAIALGASTLAMAGDHGKVLPAAQGPIPTEQVVPSAQGCGPVLPAKKCFTLPHFSLPKISFNHNYTYEWVLKKKHCGPWLNITKGGLCNKGPACDSCAAAPAAIYPTGQYSSPQSASYGSGQIYGGEVAPHAPVAPIGIEAPGGEVPPPPPVGTSMLFLPSTTGGN